MRCPVTGRYGGGFTYLVLLLAIAMIWAILGSAAIVWHTAVQREKERELLFVGKQFRTAIGRYYHDHARSYPLTLEALLKDPQQVGTRRYLRKIFHDPMTGGTRWGLVKRADGGIVGVHSLSDESPIKIAGFGKDDVNFAGAEKYSEWVFTYPLPTTPKAPAAKGGQGIQQQSEIGSRK